MRIILPGDKVRVHYVKRFQDGCVVSSRGKAPIEVTVGVDHRRLPGLGLALVGLAEGESRTLLVPAGRAYGLYDARRVYRLSQAQLVEHTSLPVGKRVRVWDRRHRRRRLVRIVEVGETMVVIDANHRWAGQSVELEVEVLAIVLRDIPSAADEGTAGSTVDPERDLRDCVWLDDGGQN